MTTAETFARACQRHGLELFNYYEYPSLIKGGHQTGQVYASVDQASCQKRALDVMIALDEAGFKEHQDEFTQETIIIAEPSVDNYDTEQYKHLTPHIYEIPLTKLSRETTNTSIAANTVALGVSAYLLGLEPQVFKDIIREQFERKGDEIVQMNYRAFDAGYEAAKGLPVEVHKKFTPTQPKSIVLNGNEALALGAIAAGVQFYAAYPMTPASNILHFLAAQQTNFPLVVKHAEDEISAINLAVGASFAGVRAMTGSAGGGFALMVETLSLTGVMELPLVIVVGQRPGPATGLPTWTCQADLQFVLHAGHGEFQRVVMTPGNVDEHYYLIQHAFYLAEKYQIPVLVMSDKFIMESHQSMPRPVDEYTIERQSFATDAQRPEDDSYRRYAITDSGVSPRSIPGQPHGLQLTNSYEHDEFGFATEEADMTMAQADKRARKMADIEKEMPQPYLVGPEDADVTFVGWGSTINVMAQLIHEQSGNDTLPSVNFIHIPIAWPFPRQKFTELTQKAKRLIMIEGNSQGQMEQLIRQETGITFEERIHRYDGRPFYVEDLREYLEL